jgi:hypothetical protein
MPCAEIGMSILVRPLSVTIARGSFWEVGLGMQAWRGDFQRSIALNLVPRPLEKATAAHLADVLTPLDDHLPA